MWEQIARRKNMAKYLFYGFSVFEKLCFHVNNEMNSK